MEIGGVCAVTGDPRVAACLLAAAARLREVVKSPLTSAERPDYVRFLKASRSRLKWDEFKQAWDRGQSQPLTASIDLAFQPFL
jgi:hypothetical protein